MGRLGVNTQGMCVQRRRWERKQGVGEGWLCMVESGVEGHEAEIALQIHYARLSS